MTAVISVYTLMFVCIYYLANLAAVIQLMQTDDDLKGACFALFTCYVTLVVSAFFVDITPMTTLYEYSYYLLSRQLVLPSIAIIIVAISSIIGIFAYCVYSNMKTWDKSQKLECLSIMIFSVLSSLLLFYLVNMTLFEKANRMINRPYFMS